MGRLGPSINTDPCFVQDDLIPARPNISIGSSTQPFSDLWVTTVHSSGSDVPTVDNIDDLGALLFRFRHLYLGSELRLANGTGGAITFRNAANGAYDSALWLDATDNTVLNAITGKVIKFSINAASIVNLSATELAGTTDAVVALGDLTHRYTNLFLSANASIGTNLVFTAASAKIIPGATSLLIRNTGDSADNLNITDAGIVTFRNTIVGSTRLQLTNAVQCFVTTSTVDAADGSILSLLSYGGTSADPTRGAYVQLNGNEAGGVGAIDCVVGSANGPFRVVVNNGGVIALSIAGATGIATFNAGIINAAGKTMSITTGGAAATSGTFVCNGTSNVTVTTTSIAVKSVVIISLNTVGGTVGAIPKVTTITAGTSFTVAGTASDTSTYNWAIIQTV